MDLLNSTYPCGGPQRAFEIHSPSEHNALMQKHYGRL